MKLVEGWTLQSTPPGAAATPAELGVVGVAAMVPGTVASALSLPLDHHVDIEGQDWWYRCVFVASGERLMFDGLATVAEIWLDGVLAARSANMFRAVTVPLCPGEHELALAFRSIPRQKRPRPRWKTNLVNDQDLRWTRTSLMGRIPAWCPPFPPVGPWRAIREASGPRLLAVRTRVDDGFSVEVELDGGGEVSLRLGQGSLTGPALPPAQFSARAPGDERPEGRLGGVVHRFDLPPQPLWSPESPSLVEAALVVDGVDLPLGKLGFRSLAFTGGEMRVNGVPRFCRGACWTVDDPRAVDGDPRPVLAEARAAGLDMIRVVGTMAYASDAFLSACDELGILVWQDFCFANMDYPVGDPEFRAEVEAEAREQVARMSRHPCLAVLCGGSEVTQQVAMMGLPASEWASVLFDEILPAAAGDIPYVPNSPSGGDLPFEVGAGVSHYWGVGAYRRPLSDLRLARVKFTSECLAFAQVPEPTSLAEAKIPVVPHHPLWKAGVPRDASAGWDFDDVRDHYLRVLYGVDPVELRSTDLERYLALSRVVPGILLHRAFAEWRRPGSGCGGGLSWWLKDLRPGAGWGFLDSAGRRKAAWWYLRRAWAPRAAFLSDEGLDGLGVHLVNDTGSDIDGSVEIEALRHGRKAVAVATQAVTVPGRSGITISASAMLGRFVDLCYAYRFGPPTHDVVCLRWRGADGQLIASDAYFPLGYALPVHDAGVVNASWTGGQLTISSTAFLHALQLEGVAASDNFVDLHPGQPMTLAVETLPGRPQRVYLSALNMDGSLTVRPG